MTIWFTLDSFRQLCFDLAAHSNWTIQEPIPDFGTRFEGRLESCLETPQQSFAGTLFYPTLIDQAAILFYLLNKNHPFMNGNKRIALTALLVFLFCNGRWLSAGQDEMLDFAINVASSKATEKEHVQERIKQFLTEHMRDLYAIPPQLIGNSGPTRDSGLCPSR